MKKKIVSVTIASVMCMAASTSFALDFPTAVSSMYGQLPPSAAAAGMGNANVATPDVQSDNPAIGPLDTKHLVGVSGSYAVADFDKGHTSQFYSLMGSTNMERLGAFALKFTKNLPNSYPASVVTDLEFDNYYRLEAKYGIKLLSNMIFNGDKLSAGVAYAHSAERFSFSYPLVLARDEFKTTSNEVTAGFAYQPLKNATLGIMYTHTWDRATQTWIWAGMPLLLASDVRNHTDILRAGASYEIFENPGTLLAFDYKHIYGPIIINEDFYFVGLRQYLVKDMLDLSVGGANGNLTAGIGIHYKGADLNFAYMYKPFEKMKQYMGDAALYMVTASYRF